MYGLDYLGGAKFSSVILDEHPMGWAAGFFSNTFGDAIPVIEALVRTGRCPRIRMHLMWKDAHDYSEKDIPFIQKEAKRVLPLILKYPNIEWRVSIFCEHNLAFTPLRKCFDSVVPILTDKVVYVNSPMKGALEPTCVNEVHGTGAKMPSGRVDFSFDGNSAFDADVEAIKAKFKSAETFYFWYSGMNGRLNDSDTTPRPQRKAWPTGPYIDSLIYLSTNRGDVKIPSDWIFKSHSDRHNTPPEPRAGKPVVIAPATAGEQIVFRVKGSSQVIAKADKGAQFAENRPGKPKRYIYRIGLEWGYVLSEKARRINGDPRVDIVYNGKVVGSCNLAFRGGSFR